MMKLLVIAALCSAIAASSIHPRIIGGKDAAEDQFPYLASYQFEKSGTYLHSCGVIVLSTEWLLTSATCIVMADTSANRRVVAGVTDLADDSSARQEREVSEEIKHPKYKGGTADPYDIGLIKLKTPLKTSKHVATVSISTDDDVSLSGKSVLPGWGKTETEFIPDNLQTIDLSILDNDECASLLKGSVASSGFTEADNICTLPVGADGSACFGDEGSPLVQDGVVLGIVSWHSSCPGEELPTVYIRVSHYLDFIEEHTGLFAKV